MFLFVFQTHVDQLHLSILAVMLIDRRTFFPFKYSYWQNFQAFKSRDLDGYAYRKERLGKRLYINVECSIRYSGSSICGEAVYSLEWLYAILLVIIIREKFYFVTVLHRVSQLRKRFSNNPCDFVELMDRFRNQRWSHTRL